MTIISVEYRRIDGWHVFTSEEVPGLYVAHEDCRTAYEAVPGSIERLMELNERKRVKVRPLVLFWRFL